jgi:hypothetical protein
MKSFFRIFNITNVILLFAIGLIPYSIRNIMETFDDFNQLKPHIGVVSEKAIKKVYRERNDSLTTTQIKLVNDESEYSISLSAIKVNNLVNVGDSIELYTKAITSQNGNEITDGSSFWYSKDSNQIFHVVSKIYDKPIVDFKDYNKNLKMGAWIAPILSIVCFIWYFIRRRNIKNPFIIDLG